MPRSPRRRRGSTRTHAVDTVNEPPTAGVLNRRTESSPRGQLARLALTTALATEGVVEGNAGPLGLRMTMDRGERVVGVVSAALPEGGYGVALHLTAHMIPLRPLADTVRSGVVAAAARAGLASELGPVDITFEDVREAGEAG